MEPLEIQEQGWTKIDSQEIWEKLNQTINGGHDGVLKNLEWSHGEYVDSELNMVFADVPKIWLLVQLQNELVSSVEFLFIGVEEMRVNPKNELILNAQIEATSATLTFSFLNESCIKANSLFYRISQPFLLGARSYGYF